ncbi:MAG: hypothetical protein ACK5LL_15030 [Suipraeoptans sp.]
MSTHINWDDMNRQFIKEQEENKKSKSREPNGKKILSILGAFAIVAILIVIICFIVSAIRDDKIEMHNVLSIEDEYKEQYTQVTSTEKYLGINKTISISELTAHVGLVNSIGNDYAVSVKIYDKNTGEVFYNSGRIMPGSIIHMATFAKEIEDIDNLALDYTIYDFSNVEQGTFETNVKFVFSDDAA